MNFLTYPARPVDGGNNPKLVVGDWSYSPMFHGQRYIIHAPSRSTWNETGNAVNTLNEFKEPLGLLELVSPFEWLDCLAIDRRVGIGRGSLIILDAIVKGVPFHERKGSIDNTFEQLSIDGNMSIGNKKLYSVPQWEGDQSKHWRRMHQINLFINKKFIQGMIMRKKDSLYPIQKNDRHQRCFEWVRFNFI